MTTIEDNQIKNFDVTADYNNQRLDRVLPQLYSDLSRSQWQRLVREGMVTVGGKSVRANYKVSTGELICATLPPPTASEIVPENIPVDVIYEDDDLIGINKPAGLVMHPAVGHETGTLANAIIYHWPNVLDIGGERRPGLVHRLDKDTSGIVLVAKHTTALNYMVDQFKARQIQKVYLALVDGHIQPEKALIDAPIGRDPNNRKRMTVIEPGRRASSQASQTRYEMTERFLDHDLVTCYPVTGRTHQIRVHLAYVGYPIAADHIYGRRKKSVPLKRHFLHAHQITFQRPSDGKELTLESPLAPELESQLNKLRGQLI